MKSICLKTVNTESIDYLLENLNKLKLDNIYLSLKNFKIYTNIIIHFTGKNEKLFTMEIAKLLTYLVIDLYEENIINNIIKNEYFYFDSIERNQILEITIEDLYNQEETVLSRDKIFDYLFNNFYEYLNYNKSIVIKGFITFRIKNYIDILIHQVDKSVNKFLLEREYNEFISLLKMYVNTEPVLYDTVHLIYNNYTSILLDKDKNIIKLDTNIANAKYLSDITFSSNDYALNTLLTILPKKIYVHLIDNKKDDFINTIKLIFEKRVTYCTDCPICKIYKKNHALI